MPVSFKRETNADQRLKRLETRAAIAAKLDRKPQVEVWCSATTAKRPSRRATVAPSGRARAAGSRKSSIIRGGSREARTDVENTVIFRSHRKRLGAKLRVSQRDAKEAIRLTAKERAEAKATGRLAEWAAATGRLMVNAIKYRIRREGLIDTGQLLESISTRTRNI